MPTRRQVFSMMAATAGLGPVVLWLARPQRVNTGMDDTGETFAVAMTDEQWRASLTDEQYYVLRGHGTERAGTSALNHERRTGTYVCAACGQALFSSQTKFDSGTGWPSFTAPLESAVGTSVDRSYLTVRTEVHCTRCGGHLGHVFPDGPPPTGLRFCMNGVAMAFKASS